MKGAGLELRFNEREPRARHPLFKRERCVLHVGAVFELVDDIGSNKICFSSSGKATMPFLATFPIRPARQVNDCIPAD